MQKSFVQRLVSTISGSSIPILYYNALLFPKHFYCSATRDKIATLGCAPISCYRGNIAHPDGFASNLERGRNLITHASSSGSISFYGPCVHCFIALLFILMSYHWVLNWSNVEIKEDITVKLG